MIYSLNSYSNFILWGLIEVNLISFVGLIIKDIKKNMRILILKYFRFQAVASILLLFRICFLFKNFLYTQLRNYFLYISLFSKLGFAPFHIWFVRIITKINWFGFIWISFLQKIIPIIILYKNFLFYELFIIVRVLACVIHGILVIKLKKMLAISSVFSLIWVYSAILREKHLWIFFFLFYNVMKILLIFLLIDNSHKSYKTTNLSNKFKLNFIIFLILLILAGIPPRPIFLLKIFTLIAIVKEVGYISSIFLIISSIIIINMYINSCVYYITQSLSSRIILEFNKEIKIRLFYYSIALYLILLFIYFLIIML